MSNQNVIIADDTVAPKETLKLIHEKLFEEYNIDVQKLYKDSKALIVIPPQWIPDIIKFSIKETPNYNFFEDAKERVVSISFETSKDCNEFFEKFNTTFLQNLSLYLESKGLNPKDFNRILTFETVLNEETLTIRY